MIYFSSLLVYSFALPISRGNCSIHNLNKYKYIFLNDSILFVFQTIQFLDNSTRYSKENQRGLDIYIDLNATGLSIFLSSFFFNYFSIFSF